MPKLPQTKIVLESLSNKKEMTELLDQLNPIIATIRQALNKNLTFRENLAAEILTVTIDGTYPFDVKWPNKNRPIAAWIGQCRETSGTHVAISTALYLDWEMITNDTFRINGIAGLSASATNKFYVTILTIIE